MQQPRAERLLEALRGARAQLRQRRERPRAQVGQRLGIGAQQQRHEVGLGVHGLAAAARGDRRPRPPGPVHRDGDGGPGPARSDGGAAPRQRAHEPLAPRAGGVRDEQDGVVVVGVQEAGGQPQRPRVERRERRADLRLGDEDGGQLDQACGDFVLPDPRPPKVLFVTAGSGITPVMGMLRNALDQLDDVVVVHSAPTAADVIFAGELRALARQGRIRLLERHTDAGGMLAPDGLAALVGDLDERETWACGPAAMLDGLERRWAERGIPARLRTTSHVGPQAYRSCVRIDTLWS